MKISKICVQNFRRLDKVQLEISDEKTVLVGANNSGKTSIMTAIQFFFKKDNFSIYDFPISHKTKINQLGKELLSDDVGEVY